MKVCDKTCIFCFFPIINKYFLMAKHFYFLDAPRIASKENLPENYPNRWPKHVESYAVYSTINLHIGIRNSWLNSRKNICWNAKSGTPHEILRKFHSYWWHKFTLTPLLYNTRHSTHLALTSGYKTHPQRSVMFPPQQWSSKRVALLRHMFTANAA